MVVKRYVGAHQMKVGIIQSNYIPWRGYFDFIKSVDLFIFHDDLQYTKGDWRNRNQIRVSMSEKKWLSVPVNYTHRTQLISETKIDYSKDWCKDHLNQVKQHFRPLPHREEVFARLQNVFEKKPQTISELNIELLKSFLQFLDIRTPLVMSSEFQPVGTKTERLIGILQKAGATSYVSGPAAQDYLDVKEFEKAKIGLEYKKYKYPEYPQAYEGFDGAVSILDLIASLGKEASQAINSQVPNEVIVSFSNS